MISVCFNTWTHQGRKGFVSLCLRDSKKQPKDDGYWRDTMFAWPGDKNKIKEWFKNNHHNGLDLYWCPAIFSKSRRTRENVIRGRVLYADLDPINPSGIPYKPTIAWESSPNRFQSLWFLDKYPADFEDMNKRMTYAVGADKSGWDLTQVLRIPNTYNYKYENPVKGKLLWKDSEIFDSINLPIIEKIDNVEIYDNLFLIDLIKKHNLRGKTSRMLQYPPNLITQGKRSDMLWALENSLIKEKVPMEDIILMIKASSWNKYRGRHDEDLRIRTEVSKVYNSLKDNTKVLKDLDNLDSMKLVGYQEIMGRISQNKGWLIKDMWMKSSHGMVAGEPKTFKSTITMDMAVSIASGEDLWGKYKVETQGPVIIVQNENADWIVKDRLEKIMVTKGLEGSVIIGEEKLDIEWPVDLPLFFLNNYGFNFSNEEHRDEFVSYVEKIEPVLIIFDPLYLMIDGDINSSQELQPILKWLLNIRNEYNTSVMVIHHYNKGGSSTRGGQRMLGSTTLHGWTDSALYLFKEDNFIMIEREFRAAGANEKLFLSVEFGEDDYKIGVVDADEAVKPTASKEDDNILQAKVFEMFSVYEKGLSVRTVGRELGVSRDKATKLLKHPDISFNNGRYLLKKRKKKQYQVPF